MAWNYRRKGIPEVVTNRTAAAALERAATELASDLAGLLDEKAREGARSAELEAAAVEAIRRGDDAEARAALLERQNSVDRVKQLDADAAVVRAMLVECREVLDQIAGSMPPQSSDEP
ncbi:MAG: hypothetical protein ACHQWU_02425 [Gemmatimonadales bacterium]